MKSASFLEPWTKNKIWIMRKIEIDLRRDLKHNHYVTVMKPSSKIQNKQHKNQNHS